jgi:hypothetical protein
MNAEINRVDEGWYPKAAQLILLYSSSLISNDSASSAFEQ